MELLAIAVVAAVLAYCVASVARTALCERPATRRPTEPASSPPPTAAERLRAANAQARSLQLALFQLAQTPDFRRAAAAASAATLVPAAFRRRQFARFRAHLVIHFRRCQAAGTSPAALAQSLRELVQSLGIAPFEADYVQAAAGRPQRPMSHPPSPAERIATLRRDHAARKAAIEQGVGTDADLREQLLEAEEVRYRDALLTAVDRPSPGPSPTL